MISAAEMTFLFEADHIDIIAFVSELAPPNFYPVVTMDEYSDILDLSLVSLAPHSMNDSAIFNRGSLVLILVLYHSGAPLIDIHPVRVYFHQAPVQLHYYLGACHQVVLPHHGPFQSVHQALIRNTRLHP
jgi:hypothetical protein